MSDGRLKLSSFSLRRYQTLFKMRTQKENIMRDLNTIMRCSPGLRVKFAAKLLPKRDELDLFDQLLQMSD